jgi:hypothetical protein
MPILLEPRDIIHVSGTIGPTAITSRMRSLSHIRRSYKALWALDTFRIPNLTGLWDNVSASKAVILNSSVAFRAIVRPWDQAGLHS